MKSLTDYFPPRDIPPRKTNIPAPVTLASKPKKKKRTRESINHDKQEEREQPKLCVAKKYSSRASIRPICFHQIFESQEISKDEQNQVLFAGSPVNESHLLLLLASIHHVSSPCSIHVQDLFTKSKPDTIELTFQNVNMDADGKIDPSSTPWMVFCEGSENVNRQVLAIGHFSDFPRVFNVCRLEPLESDAHLQYYISQLVQLYGLPLSLFSPS